MWRTGAYGYLSDYLAWVTMTGLVFACTALLFRAWPKDNRSRWRLVCGNLAIGLCLVAGTALLAETYLRFVSTATDVLGATQTCKRWKLAYASLNSLYCRDREWTETKPPSTYRIALVGDSFTYGWGINDPADRFTEQLQARFDARGGRRVEVMNVAWAAWDTREQLAMIRDNLGPYDIDEIVLCYLPNDIEQLIPDPEDANPRVAPTTQILNVESSFLLDWIFHRVIAPRMLARFDYLKWLSDGYAEPDIWGKQVDIFSELVGLCEERAIRLRVVLFPFLRGETESYDARRIHEQVAAWFRDHGIEVLDLLPAVESADRDALILGRHDPHPNEKAHRLFDSAIWKSLYEGRDYLDGFERDTSAGT